MLVNKSMTTDVCHIYTDGYRYKLPVGD